MELFDFTQFKGRQALIDGESGKAISYGNLIESAEHFAGPLGHEKSLVFFFIRSTLDDLISYLALLRCGHAVALFDGDLHPDLKSQLIDFYRPHYIVETAMPEQTSIASVYMPLTAPLPSVSLWRRRNLKESPEVHPELTLLLSTSGTTGSPKLIRLSKNNIASNARAICSYLEINLDESAIATLPFHYSYGLSVLHSHLAAGASLVLTQHSVVQEGFWQTLNRYGCTSFAGVPYLYQLLDRIGFENLACPTLRTLTQAGGRLSAPLILKFHAIMDKRKGRFFTMYGQTEATARIAYLPLSFLPAKAGAIGIPIPGGKLQIYDGAQEITESNQEGELVYTGDNVMLGYAEKPEDLVMGDQLQGTLHTGDLGYRDSDGVYYLTGRLKRFCKVYGQRINLQEIENAASAFGEVAAASDDITIRLYYEKGSKMDTAQCIAFLSGRFHLAPSTFECIEIEHWPLTASGKIDYTKLK